MTSDQLRERLVAQLASQPPEGTRWRLLTLLRHPASVAAARELFGGINPAATSTQPGPPLTYDLVQLFIDIEPMLCAEMLERICSVQPHDGMQEEIVRYALMSAARRPDFVGATTGSIWQTKALASGENQLIGALVCSGLDIPGWQVDAEAIRSTFWGRFYTRTHTTGDMPPPPDLLDRLLWGIASRQHDAGDLLSRLSFGELPAPLSPYGLRRLLASSAVVAHQRRYVRALDHGLPQPHATQLVAPHSSAEINDRLESLLTVALQRPFEAARIDALATMVTEIARPLPAAESWPADAQLEASLDQGAWPAEAIAYLYCCRAGAGALPVIRAHAGAEWPLT
jgi:hypothetical protein